MSHWCRWEYCTLAFTSEQDVSAKLNALGAAGWEAYFVTAGAVLLKRQHPVMPAAQRAPSRPMPDLVRGKPEPEGD